VRAENSVCGGGGGGYRTKSRRSARALTEFDYEADDPLFDCTRSFDTSITFRRPRQTTTPSLPSAGGGNELCSVFLRSKTADEYRSVCLGLTPVGVTSPPVSIVVRVKRVTPLSRGRRGSVVTERTVCCGVRRSYGSARNLTREWGFLVG